jgi:hypothetical protein
MLSQNFQLPCSDYCVIVKAGLAWTCKIMASRVRGYLDFHLVWDRHAQKEK